MKKVDGSVKEILSSSLLGTLYYKNSNGKIKLTIRAWRWLSIFIINILFFLSFNIDIQVLEGTLNGSRLFGFHLIDPFTALEIFAAEHHFHINVIIGSVTLVVFYLLVGGKAYCSWVCPYGFLSELGEHFHQKLVRKKIIKEHKFTPNIRFLFWAIFLAAAFIDGYLVFEVINPIGYISRVITYGWSLGAIWVLVVLAIETFYSRRAWCKYICPVGTTYNMLGWVSATKVNWDMSKCDHCGACLSACFEEHVIEFIKPKFDKDRKKKGIEQQIVINGDCTMCGRCFDVCHTDAYNYTFKLKDLI